MVVSSEGEEETLKETEEAASVFDEIDFKPISVLSGVSRLFEKVVHGQLFVFPTANSLLSDNQFAYCKLHSTITSLMNSTDTWYKNIDEKKINISLFLDISKAFDTINHEMLLSKLGKYGIIQNELTWFTSYLTGRKQYCYFGVEKLKETRGHMRHTTRVMFGTSSIHSVYE